MTAHMTRQRADRQKIQRRTVAILSLATILGGLGVGASFSAGSLLIVQVTGNTALGGFGSTLNALGAAIAGIPLARAAARRGRRVALATGNLIAVFGAVLIIASAVLVSGWLIFIGFGLLGVGSAVQLQSRFAAADLAIPENRARDLSLVVWSITIGAVVGPNLIDPGMWVGEYLGITGLAGIFVFTIIAQLLSSIVVWVGLRPDPLLESRRTAALERGDEEVATEAAGENATTPAAPSQPQPRPRSTPATFGAAESALPQFVVIAMIAGAHAVMVGLMSMTPLHLMAHGGTVTLVGLTLSLHIAGMYALSPIAGMLTGKFGALPVMLGGFVLLGASALGTAFGNDSVPVIQLALVLLGVGWCGVTVAGAALLTEVTPSDVRPKRQGQSDTIMNAAGALFGAVSGVIFMYGGFPMLSIVAGLFIASGLYSGFWLLRAHRRQMR